MKNQCEFICGFACAVAELSRAHGEQSLAKYLIQDAGFSIKDFKGIEKYDLDEIKKILNIKSNKRRQRS